MRYHSEVISYWPSTSELAQDVGANAEMVRKWEERKRIPADWWHDVAQAAQKRNYPVDIQKLSLAKRKRKHS